jgi:hypothetical protein
MNFHDVDSMQFHHLNNVQNIKFFRGNNDFLDTNPLNKKNPRNRLFKSYGVKYTTHNTWAFNSKKKNGNSDDLPAEGPMTTKVSTRVVSLSSSLLPKLKNLPDTHSHTFTWRT